LHTSNLENDNKSNQLSTNITGFEPGCRYISDRKLKPQIFAKAGLNPTDINYRLTHVAKELKETYLFSFKTRLFFQTNNHNNKYVSVCNWLYLLNIFWFLQIGSPLLMENLFLAAIGNAFSVLSDSQKRQRYDEFGIEDSSSSRTRRANGYDYDYSRGFEGVLFFLSRQLHFCCVVYLS